MKRQPFASTGTQKIHTTTPSSLVKGGSYPKDIRPMLKMNTTIPASKSKEGKESFILGYN